MDHRNADGSHAEMCGNGIRLFLHVLVTEGLLDRAACEAGVLVGTRGGPRRVGATPDGGYWVDMGPARPFGDGEAQRGGAGLPGPRRCRWATRTWPASPTSTSTPWTSPPRRRSTPALFPEGVNVELINVLDARRPHIRLRVFERGVGETRSCGTGACAAAYAALVGGRPDRGDRRRRRPRRPPVGAGRRRGRRSSPARP